MYLDCSILPIFLKIGRQAYKDIDIYLDIECYCAQKQHGTFISCVHTFHGCAACHTVFYVGFYDRADSTYAL